MGYLEPVHFIYLDESGDLGLTNSPTTHYILAGFSIHHGDWAAFSCLLRSFRLEIHAQFGFPATKELHAAELLGGANAVCGVGRHERLLIARHLIYRLARCGLIKVFAWVVRKSDTCPIALIAPCAMRDLERWTQAGALSDAKSCQHKGFYVIHDRMSSPLFKDMPRPPLLVGHPIGQCSQEVEMIQVADLIAYAVKQKYSPNRYALRSGAVTLCDKLKPISLGWIEVS